MGLAEVVVTPEQFDKIHYHLENHLPPHRSMHLRKVLTRKQKREMIYLHAIHANEASNKEIEGMISGPGIFLHYKMFESEDHVRLISHSPESKELAKVLGKLVSSIIKRMEQEKEYANREDKRRKAGFRDQFYLKRGNPGMVITHDYCKQAVETKLLDKRFVSILEPWKLCLYRGSR